MVVTTSTMQYIFQAPKRHDTLGSRFGRKVLVCMSLFAGCVLIQSSALGAASDDIVSSALSRSFQCPEDYASFEAKQTALQQFIQEYTKNFPNNNLRDMLLFRYRLLVAHSCVQTLNSMLADVSPLSEMLSMQNGNYGPRTEEFDPKTKIWTVHFRKDGEPPALANEELIFNFYGWKPATSTKNIAEAFVNRRDDVRIVGSFEAPDDVTKAPAYFIFSEAIDPGQPEAYIYISKISSVGGGAYTVTFSKKISGANSEEKGKAWFVSEEGQSISRAIAHVGVDPHWEEHFAQTTK